jgi:hypothetical protein
MTPKMEVAPEPDKFATKRPVISEPKSRPSPYDKHSRGRSRSKSKEAPAPENVIGPARSASKGNSALSTLLLTSATKPASRLPSAQPAAKAASRPPSAQPAAKAASRPPSAQPAAAAQPVAAVREASVKPTKRGRSASKTPAQPVDTIVIPRGRSTTPGMPPPPVPYSGPGRRIASEPPAGFRGQAARLRSRTPAPKQTPASSSTDPAPAAAAEEQGTSKARKKAEGDTASINQVLVQPSKLKKGQLEGELSELSNRPGFNPDDAKRMRELGKDIDGAEPGRLMKIQEELKGIYKRNYDAISKKQRKDT